MDDNPLFYRELRGKGALRFVGVSVARRCVLSTGGAVHGRRGE
jgi:hypothetical protein